MEVVVAAAALVATGVVVALLVALSYGLFADVHRGRARPPAPDCLVRMRRASRHLPKPGTRRPERRCVHCCPRDGVRRVGHAVGGRAGRERRGGRGVRRPRARGGRPLLPSADAGAAPVGPGVRGTVAIVAGFLVFGIVVAIAAVFVVREAGRIAVDPPAALVDPDDAYEWVVDHLPDDVAATLTPDDVRRILEFQFEFFRRKGVSVNGTRSGLAGRSSSAAPSRSPTSSTGHRRRGRPTSPSRCTRSSRPSSATCGPSGRSGHPRIPTRFLRRPDPDACYTMCHQGKEVVHSWVMNTGPWRCAAARSHTFGPPGGIPPPHRRRVCGDWSLPREDAAFPEANM